MRLYILLLLIITAPLIVVCQQVDTTGYIGIDSLEKVLTEHYINRELDIAINVTISKVITTFSLKN